MGSWTKLETLIRNRTIRPKEMMKNRMTPRISDFLIWSSLLRWKFSQMMLMGSILNFLTLMGECQYLITSSPPIRYLYRSDTYDLTLGRLKDTIADFTWLNLQEWYQFKNAFKCISSSALPQLFGQSLLFFSVRILLTKLSILSASAFKEDIFFTGEIQTTSPNFSKCSFRVCQLQVIGRSFTRTVQLLGRIRWRIEDLDSLAALTFQQNSRRTNVREHRTSFQITRSLELLSLSWSLTSLLSLDQSQYCQFARVVLPSSLFHPPPKPSSPPPCQQLTRVGSERIPITSIPTMNTFMNLKNKNIPGPYFWKRSSGAKKEYWESPLQYIFLDLRLSSAISSSG